GPQVPSLWQNAITELAARPNVACKLSGFLGVPAPAAPTAPVPVPDAPLDVAHLRPYYRIALEAFGPDRLLFGSDWPVSTLQTEYSGVLAVARALTADLSPVEQDAIFRGTAQRVYQLLG
ncbi:MAG: amidohydrolase family protein, partial [Actinomycetota bacterium]